MSFAKCPLAMRVLFVLLFLFQATSAFANECVQRLREMEEYPQLTSHRHDKALKKTEKFAALKWYTGDGYKDINCYLIVGQTPRSAMLDTMISRIKNDLSHLPAFKGTVYHGDNRAGEFYDLREGIDFNPKNFLSTSLKESVASHFSLVKYSLPVFSYDNAVIMKIESKTGRKIRTFSHVPDEEEVLFAPDSKFLIRHVELIGPEKGRALRIDLEEVAL